MTPKQKAIELVEKMYSTQGPEYGITEYEAKQCALIANNEILEYSKAHGFIELTKFHEEVKQEIEKL